MNLFRSLLKIKQKIKNWEIFLPSPIRLFAEGRTKLRAFEFSHLEIIQFIKWAVFTHKYIHSLVLLSYEYTDSLEEILFSCLLYFVHKCLSIGIFFWRQPLASADSTGYFCCCMPVIQPVELICNWATILQVLLCTEMVCVRFLETNVSGTQFWML